MDTLNAFPSPGRPFRLPLEFFGAGGTRGVSDIGFSCVRVAAHV